MATIDVLPHHAGEQVLAPGRDPRRGGPVSLSILAFVVLIAAFVWGSVTAVNAGLIAIVAAFVVGTLAAGLPVEEVIDQFPAGLFFILAGATLLFAMVKATGTIDLLAHWAELLARERRPLIPVLMFLLTAILATAGAFTPAAVAIVAPVALNLGARYGFSRLAIDRKSTRLNSSHANISYAVF